MKKDLWLLLLLLLALLTFTSHAQDDIEDELAELVTNYLEDGPGIVLYINYDGDEWLVADGYSDIEREIEMETDDLFRLASVSKSFVATVVLQLVSEGLLNLDERIAEYLPAEIIENIENADEATIRQMLQMTSGIYNYTESDAYYEAVEADPDYPWKASEVIEFAYGEDAYFDVGDDYTYSNTNYILAQLIIEAARGNSLADELENRIFEPLGMDSCYLETPDVFAENLARGYTWMFDDYIDITEVNDGVGLGDGGIVCNAEDLGIFLPALYDGELLNDAMLEEMFDVLESGEGEGYGLGIVVEDGDYGLEIWHDGASSGFQSLMDYLPDENLSVVILTNNFDSEIVGDLFYDALDTVLDE
jgi:D-alanyl-D-alanine carboxypeptidase